MKTLKKITQEVLALLLVLIPMVNVKALDDASVATGTNPSGAKFTYTLPAAIRSMFRVTAKVENGRTVFDITNTLNTTELTEAEVAAILTQASGVGAKELSYYATLSIDLTSASKYATMKYRGNTNKWAMTPLDVISQDTEAGAKNLKFDFWPFALKVAYRTTESGEWQYGTATVNAKKSLKARLAELLGIQEDQVLAQYGKLYRFETVVDGKVDTHRFDFYADKNGVPADMSDPTTLEHLGTEYFEIRYNYNEARDTIKEEELNNIENILNNTTASTVAVEMENNAYAFDNDFFQAIKASGKDVVLDYGTYSVTIKSSDITKEVTNVNFDLFTSDKAPEAAKEALEKYESSDGKTFFLTTTYSGELPGPVTISLKTPDTIENGSKVWVYYYNEETGKLEFVAKDQEVIDGMLNVDLQHFSTYLVSNEMITDAINNPDTADLNLTLIVSLGLIAVAGGFAVIKKRFS